MTSSGEAASVVHAQADEVAETGIGESRWPPAVALVVFIALNIGLRVWLPHEGAVRAPWLVPAVEAVLLLALVVGNPGNISKLGHWPRRVIVTLVVVLVAAALWATILLVYDLIEAGISTKLQTLGREPRFSAWGASSS